MKQVRLLHLQKQMASKAVPAGPPRRIVFGNLPELADISSVLQLVYGGAIERAWSENGEVIVQFVEQDVCVKYFEDHCEGINLKDGDNDITISVVMPEEGLQDNANSGSVCKRVLLASFLSLVFQLASRLPTMKTSWVLPLALTGVGRASNAF